MTAAVGTVYLIHFDQRYKHAGHYIGWALDLGARLAEHARGQGARLMAVIREAGITWRLARTWPGETRGRERQLKRRHGASRFCPCCGIRPRAAAGPPVQLVSVPRPATVPPPVLVPPRAPAYELGAAKARALIGQQTAAGQDPARIVAIQRAMFRDYDPETARPEAREWHRGYADAAADLIGAAL